MQDEAAETMATVIQAFLLNVGINTEIKILDQAAGATIDTDPDGYDIKIFGMGGGSLIGEWNRVMNNHELGTDYSVGFVKDPELQRLFEVANAIDTHTPENMTALQNYVQATWVLLCDRFSQNQHGLYQEHRQRCLERERVHSAGSLHLHPALTDLH